MLNLPELEKRWLRYKIRTFLPYITVTIIVLLLMVLFLYREDFLPKTALHNDNNKVSEIKKTPVVKLEAKQAEPEKEQKVVSEKHTPSNIIKLQPSMHFMDNFDQQNLQNTQYTAPHIQKKPQKKVQKEHSIPKKITQHKTKSSIKITIKREETQQDLQQVIKRFQHNKNPALSLFIAKKYYELGNYAQAYNYALITNQLNESIEASWIIFAKSLVKLHKKRDAIRILQKFINNTHSSTAAMLLHDIRTGKFQ